MAKIVLVQGNLDERALQFLAVVERYRGPIPAGALLAIAEHESDMGARGYNPEETSGGHAYGPWQILEKHFADYGVSGETVSDLDASTRGVARKRKVAHQYIKELVPEALKDLRFYTYLLYSSHYAGNRALKNAMESAKNKYGKGTVENMRDWGKREGLTHTAERAEYWEAWAAAQRPFPTEKLPVANADSSWPDGRIGNLTGDGHLPGEPGQPQPVSPLDAESGATVMDAPLTAAPTVLEEKRRIIEVAGAAIVMLIAALLSYWGIHCVGG